MVFIKMSTKVDNAAGSKNTCVIYQSPLHLLQEKALNLKLLVIIMKSQMI